MIKTISNITKSKIEQLFNEIQREFNGFYEVYQSNEGDIKDWKEMAKHLKDIFEGAKLETSISNAFFVKATQRPFGLIFDFEGQQVKFFVKAKNIGWSHK